jgi:NDP-sugar pyrophosphorylase family protein
MKAMILAAGKGTRMMPLTLNTPKPLIEIQGISLLEHTIRYLKYYGVTEIIINIHHLPGQIIDFVTRNNSFGIHIEFSDESGELLDTGGGLYKAGWFFDDCEPFILISSDVITTLNLHQMMQEFTDADPLVLLAVKHRNSTRDFIFDSDYNLIGWHNNKTGENRLICDKSEFTRAAFSTIHVIHPRIFDLITERNRFSIIDLYLRLALENKVKGFLHDDSEWFECGRFESLEMLNRSPEIKRIIKKYE